MHGCIIDIVFFLSKFLHSAPGGGEEVLEETVTVSMVYIEPNAAEPTKDTTKDFTPRVETATVREKARPITPRKPIRTEVSTAGSKGVNEF